MNEGRLHPAALLGLLLGAVGLLVLVLLLRPGRSGERLSEAELASSRACLECHPGVAEEWRSSHHAFAFENPEVRKLSNDFANEECLACHAPRPVLGFAPGERVLARAADRALGVDCLACHALPDGSGVATGNPSPSASAPCRPVHVERMGQVEHCAACHNQHGTVDQWRTAPETFEGRVLRGGNCLHCHMPEVFRSGGRRGRDHAFRASHDPEALREAVRLEAESAEEAVLLRVVNHGCAHNFPTDERSRAADVQVRFRSAAGWEPWRQLYRMRDPYRDEVDLTNTQLPSGQTWETRVPWPEGAREAEARLLYKTNPFLPDEEAVVVHSARVPAPGAGGGR